MGTMNFSFGDLMVYTIDGKPMGKLSEVTGTELSDTEADNNVNFTRGPWEQQEITGTITLTGRMVAAFKRIVFGWKAKGPVRERIMVANHAGGKIVGGGV